MARINSSPKLVTRVKQRFKFIKNLESSLHFTRGGGLERRKNGEDNDLPCLGKFLNRRAYRDLLILRRERASERRALI